MRNKESFNFEVAAGIQTMSLKRDVRCYKVTEDGENTKVFGFNQHTIDYGTEPESKVLVQTALKLKASERYSADNKPLKVNHYLYNEGGNEVVTDPHTAHNITVILNTFGFMPEEKYQELLKKAGYTDPDEIIPTRVLTEALQLGDKAVKGHINDQKEKYNKKLKRELNPGILARLIKR